MATSISMAAIAAEAAVEPSRPIVLVAAVALIDPDGRVLLAQRPEGKHLAGLWGFPGGQVHPGETPEAAPIRGVGAELGLHRVARCPAPLTFASHPYPPFPLPTP